MLEDKEETKLEGPVGCSCVRRQGGDIRYIIFSKSKGPVGCSCAKTKKTIEETRLNRWPSHTVKDPARATEVRQENQKELRRLFFNKTNLQNKGLISANRGTRATRCVQYLVLYLSRIQRICHSRYLNLFFSIACNSFSGATVPLQCYDLGPKAIATHVTSWNTTYRHFSAWILA